MYGYLLQDWITLRGTASGATFVQSEPDWMSFQAYSDIVFWLEVKAVTLGGLTSMTLDYETAPVKDEALLPSPGRTRCSSRRTPACRSRDGCDGRSR